MTPATLFARRGPDEPARPHALFQSDPAYIAGREDYLFGRRRREYLRDAEQRTYDCAWSIELTECRAIAGIMRCAS